MGRVLQFSPFYFYLSCKDIHSQCSLNLSQTQELKSHLHVEGGTVGWRKLQSATAEFSGCSPLACAAFLQAACCFLLHKTKAYISLSRTINCSCVRVLCNGRSTPRGRTHAALITESVVGLFEHQRILKATQTSQGVLVVTMQICRIPGNTAVLCRLFKGDNLDQRPKRRTESVPRLLLLSFPTEV